MPRANPLRPCMDRRVLLRPLAVADWPTHSLSLSHSSLRTHGHPPSGYSVDPFVPMPCPPGPRSQLSQGTAGKGEGTRVYERVRLLYELGWPHGPAGCKQVTHSLAPFVTLIPLLARPHTTPMPCPRRSPLSLSLSRPFAPGLGRAQSWPLPTTASQHCATNTSPTLMVNAETPRRQQPVTPPTTCENPKQVD